MVPIRSNFGFIVTLVQTLFAFGKSSSLDLKKILYWIWGFLWWRHNGGILFSSFWLKLPGSRRQANEPIFRLKVLLESRLSPESVEALIGLLAYLEPKLWLKKHKLRKNYTRTNDDPGYIIPIAITGGEIEFTSSTFGTSAHPCQVQVRTLSGASEHSVWCRCALCSVQVSTHVGCSFSALVQSWCSVNVGAVWVMF